LTGFTLPKPGPEDRAGRLSQQPLLRLDTSAHAQPPACQGAIALQIGRALQGTERSQVLIIPQTDLQAQVIQNGQGHAVQTLGLPRATVIQNSLNNQWPRSQTVIHVSRNGLDALRHLNLQNTLTIGLRTRPTLR
jgi:hypothetical protein